MDSEAAQAKTKIAKSVLGAGWGQLKTMLDYKCAHPGIVFKDVNEAYTTQSCGYCDALPDSRPKGIAGLGIREWTCECGVTHNRDVNATKNILAVGHGRLAVGIPALLDSEDVKPNPAVTKWPAHLQVVEITHARQRNHTLVTRDPSQLAATGFPIRKPSPLSTGYPCCRLVADQSYYYNAEQYPTQA